MRIFYLFVPSLIFNFSLCENDLASYDDLQSKNTELRSGFTPLDRYRIAKSSGECIQLEYKGKGMDFNNFKTQEECEKHKRKTADELEKKVRDVASKTSTYPSDSPSSKCEGVGVRKFYLKITVDGSVHTYTCEEFNFNGCGAGENLFDTRKECENAQKSVISHQKSKFDCYITPKTDPGHENELRVIADMENHRCVHAIIGDSVKNGIFDSLKQCVDICLSGPREANPKCTNGISQQKCNRKVVTKYFYNKISKTCNPYLTEDCGHHEESNVFDNLDECVGSCPTFHDTSDEDFKGYTKANDLCRMQLNEGDGELKLIRFYYDYHTSACMQFQYRGIGGNFNNFVSKQECMAVCTGRTFEIEKMPTSDTVTEKPTNEDGDIITPTTDSTVDDKNENKELVAEGEDEIGLEVEY